MGIEEGKSGSRDWGERQKNENEIRLDIFYVESKEKSLIFSGCKEFNKKGKGYK